MVDLEGTPKVIFEEIMDEIDEEIRDALESLLAEQVLAETIRKIQENTANDVESIIREHYSEDMRGVHKLILGEKASRVVAKEAKKELVSLTERILRNSFDLLDELRNEIIGEVFEETE
ncbi:MAG: hypothetical protein D6732_23885 [Methanobacteriota archaeon]|nr:MAG: hypothetical protein D6732_23885 [Euryarchaeota archaeon]